MGPLKLEMRSRPVGAASLSFLGERNHSNCKMEKENKPQDEFNFHFYQSWEVPPQKELVLFLFCVKWPT